VAIKQPAGTAMFSSPFTQECLRAVASGAHLSSHFSGPVASRLMIVLNFAVCVQYYTQKLGKNRKIIKCKENAHAHLFSKQTNTSVKGRICETVCLILSSCRRPWSNGNKVTPYLCV